MITKERPILFSGPMVKAILAGIKTQTRREVKWPKKAIDADGAVLHETRSGNWWPVAEYDGYEKWLDCPYGKVGDRLWVRETWRPEFWGNDGAVKVTYQSDELSLVFDAEVIGDDWQMPKAASNKNVPSIRMPRWASRITLELTDVRVERLQEITPEDAICEGIWCYAMEKRLAGHWTTAFARLRDEINGPGSWELNPWVWVVSFKRTSVNTTDAEGGG
jgi:hypothetical protein